MRNTIKIIVDSEKKPAITFEKGVGSPIPQTHEEAQPMILIDTNCITEALITLIDVADQNDYADKDRLVLDAVTKLINYSNSSNNKTLDELLESLNKKTK